MLRKIATFLARWSDRTVCYDIAANRKKELDNLEALYRIKAPENFKWQYEKLQLQNSIMDRFSTEKNNRLIVVMTFVVMLLTVALVLLTGVLLFKN